MTTHHSFDRQSRRYLGPCPIPASILDPVNGSAAPANTLPIEPPVPSDNEVVLVNETFDNWELVPDFTGTVYQKADGQRVEHKELGPLPNTLTPLKPLGQYDEWDETSNSWVKNKEAEKSDYYDRTLESLKQERNHHRKQGPKLPRPSDRGHRSRSEQYRRHHHRLQPRHKGRGSSRLLEGSPQPIPHPNRQTRSRSTGRRHGHPRPDPVQYRSQARPRGNHPHHRTAHSL